MKRNDWILASGILAAAVLTFCIQTLRNGQEAAAVRVSVDGAEFGSYNLDSDVSVNINGTNRMRIQDGAVWVEWADCPDQICTGHRKIRKDGESIICLPNKVVISVESTEENELDGIAQ